MDKQLFNLLIEISDNGFITIERRKTINRDQAILDDERYERLKYLLSQGLISKINNSYIITEYGYSVAQFNNWNEYLVFQKEVIDKKIKKERLDLKISEFQVKTKYLPYFISVLSIIISAIAIWVTIKHRTKSIEEDPQKTEIQLENKQQDKSSTIDTTQTNMEVQKSQENVSESSLLKN